MLDEMFDLEGIVAPFGQRVAAWLIDAGIGFGSAFVLWIVFGTWPALLGLVYLLLKDGVHRGQSVGKRLFHLQVVDSNTGQPCNYLQSALRNAPVALGIFCPIELVVAAMTPEGVRIGDYLASTLVIETARTRRGGAPVDLSHPTEGLDRLSRITGMEVDESLKTELCEESSASVEYGTDLESPEPYRALNLPSDSDREAIDDAYWSFMNKYADDVVRELPPEDLDFRCEELQERFRHLDMAQLGVTIGYSRRLTDKEKRLFIHQHVVAINSARDSLLR